MARLLHQGVAVLVVVFVVALAAELLRQRELRGADPPDDTAAAEQRRGR